MKFSPLEAAVTGFGFVVRRPLWVLRFVILAALVTAGTTWLVARIPLEASAGILSIATLMIFASAIAHAAVLRNLVRDEDGGITVLRFGPDEWRLAGVIALIASGLAMLSIVGVFMTVGVINQGHWFAATLYGEGAGIWGAWIFGLLAAALTIGSVVYLAIRLSLSPAATIGRREMGIAASWDLTHGRFEDLFKAYAMNIAMAAIFFAGLAAAGWAVLNLLGAANLAPQALDIQSLANSLKTFTALDPAASLKLAGAAAVPLILAQAIANGLAVIFPAGVGANAYLSFSQTSVG